MSIYNFLQAISCHITNQYYIYRYLHFLRQNILISQSLNGFFIIILLETVFFFFCLHRNELINFSFWTKVLVRKLIAYSIATIPFDAMNIFQWKVGSFRFTIVIWSNLIKKRNLKLYCYTTIYTTCPTYAHALLTPNYEYL